MASFEVVTMCSCEVITYCHNLVAHVRKRVEIISRRSRNTIRFETPIVIELPRGEDPQLAWGVSVSVDGLYNGIVGPKERC